MANSNTLNQTQREEFKAKLRDLLRKAEQRVSEKSAEAHQMALQKLLDAQGATELAANFKTLSQEVRDVESQLENRGFETRGDEVRLSYSADDVLRKTYDEFVDEQIGSEKEPVQKLSEAIGNVWSIGTLAEAKQLVDSFAQ